MAATADAAHAADAAAGPRGPGALLHEHRPPRAHPILPAGLIVFGVVFATGSLENLLRAGRPALYAVYALPFLATLLLMVALWPSPTRIHEHGIAPSRPLLLRWRRPFVRWDGLVAVYPATYDVTGAFVSPFASSDGKVTQTGLALERPDGRTELVRFTPALFTAWEMRSAGFEAADAAVRAAFARRGRPPVPSAERFSAEEARRLAAEAGKPFLPFFAIVFLFASAAPLLWLLTRPLDVPVAAALPLCVVPPLAVSLRSWHQSRRRHAILNRLHKAAAFERQQVLA